MFNRRRTWSVSLAALVLLVGIVFGALGASSLTGAPVASPMGSHDVQVQGLTGASTPLSANLGITPTAIDLGQTLNVATTASGGNPSPSYAYHYYGMPAGCTINQAQSFTCTPTSSGNFGINVSVTDNNGNTTSSNVVDVTINPALTVSLSISPSSTSTGQSVNIQSSAQGGAGSYTYTYFGLPSNCAGNTMQQFQCSPSQSGNFNVYVEVTDSVGQSVQSSTQSLHVTSSSGNGNGNNGNGGGNNSSNPFSNLLSGFSGVLSLLIIAGVIGLVTWILLIVGVWIIAVVLYRRLPKRGEWSTAAASTTAMTKCASCSASIPVGSKFCPQCGAATTPKIP
jgi:hypothetical protein